MQMKSSCNIASKAFMAQLKAIEPSDAGACAQHQKLYPCKLVLKDGRIIDRAICAEEHRGFRTDAWIHPDDISRIEPTKERLPAKYASQLYAEGESGMGYMLFELKMDDRTTHVFVAGSARVDFPDYPDGYNADNVVAVYPHQGRDHSAKECRESRGCYWCFFVEE
jgi:hypothetical protein